MKHDFLNSFDSIAEILDLTIERVGNVVRHGSLIKRSTYRTWLTRGWHVSQSTCFLVSSAFFLISNRLPHNGLRCNSGDVEGSAAAAAQAVWAEFARISPVGWHARG